MVIRKKALEELIRFFVCSAFLATCGWAQTTPVTTTTGGAINAVPKFDGTSSITNSVITESNGAVNIGSFTVPGGPGEVASTGLAAGWTFVDRSLTSWPANPVAGNEFVLYDQNGTAHLWTTQNGDVFRTTSDGIATFGPFAVQLAGQGTVSSTGTGAGLGFMKRTLTSWSNPGAGDYFAWYNPDGAAHLWSIGVGDVLTVQNSGELDLGGTLKFPDGSTQTTATLRGPAGPQGPQGPQGPAGPAVHTSAVCGYNPACPGGFVVNILEGTQGCFVTSDTGNCGLPGGGGRTCAVCRP